MIVLFIFATLFPSKSTGFTTFVVVVGPGQLWFEVKLSDKKINIKMLQYPHALQYAIVN